MKKRMDSALRIFTINFALLMIFSCFTSCSKSTAVTFETIATATDSDTPYSDVTEETFTSEISITETEKSSETTSVTESVSTEMTTMPISSQTEPVTTIRETSSDISEPDSSTRKSLFDIFSIPTDLEITLTTKKQVQTDSNGNVDFSCFDNCAFVGNSRLLSVGNFGFAKNVYAKVGLNVRTVFTERCEGSSCVVIDELKGKKFEKIFLMFGDNECGWDSMSVFEKEYTKVINAVRERVPDSEIYLLSVLPISKDKSAMNEFGYNKGSIKVCNDHIKAVASSQNLKFIDVNQSISDSDGYLPEDASGDGCHLGKKYTRKWLEYLAYNM